MFIGPLPPPQKHLGGLPPLYYFLFNYFVSQHSAHSQFQLITLGNSLGEKRKTTTTTKKKKKKQPVDVYILPDPEFYTQSQHLDTSGHTTPLPRPHHRDFLHWAFLLLCLNS